MMFRVVTQDESEVENVVKPWGRQERTMKLSSGSTYTLGMMVKNIMT